MAFCKVLLLSLMALGVQGYNSPQTSGIPPQAPYTRPLTITEVKDLLDLCVKAGMFDNATNMAILVDTVQASVNEKSPDPFNAAIDKAVPKGLITAATANQLRTLEDMVVENALKQQGLSPGDRPMGPPLPNGQYMKAPPPPPGYYGPNRKIGRSLMAL